VQSLANVCSRAPEPSWRRSRVAGARGEDFVDKGQQHYEEQQHQRSVAALKRRAAALGFEIKLSPVPA
jgi:hypothetical protein